MSVGNPTMNRMSTEMSGANRLSFRRRPASPAFLKDARRCQWPHRSLSAAIAVSILRKAAVFPIGNDFEVRSGREVPLPPRSLSLFDYDDLGSARPGIMSAIEIGASGTRAGNRQHFSSSRCNSSPASRHRRMPPEPAMVAAGGVRGPGAGSRRLRSLGVRCRLTSPKWRPPSRVHSFGMRGADRRA